jgi:putative PepSY-like beta-lactamase-inhibitor
MRWFLALVLVGGVARAETMCPAAVKNAIAKAFPKATIAACKAEKEHGHDQFEVKIAKADGNKAEVDVSPDGKILQVEEKIALDKVPAAVMKAFSAKYPKAKADAAEKQTPATGAPTYELAFATDKGRKEATFSEDGKFVEEE